MPELTEEEAQVLVKLLNDRTIHNLMGAEEWSLTEDEEITLWGLIDKVRE